MSFSCYTVKCKPLLLKGKPMVHASISLIRTFSRPSATVPIRRLLCTSLRAHQTTYQVTQGSVPHPQFHNRVDSKSALKTYQRELTRTVKQSGGDEASTPVRYDSLVLSGGGAKGAGYAGLIQELKDSHYLEHIDDMVGTSIGSMVVLALSLGAPVQAIQLWMANSKAKFDAITMKTQLENILFDTFEPSLPSISTYLKIKGEPLLDSNGQEFNGLNGKACLANFSFKQHQLLVEASSSSFLPKGMKNLTIVASINGKYEVELSSKNTPQIPIITAAIASSSMPDIMPPVLIPRNEFNTLPPVNLSQQLQLYDGALTNNTPHIYARGQRKLVVTPYSQKVLLPQNHSALNIITEEVKLAVSSLLLGFNAARVLRLNRFDIRKAVSDPRVSLLFLKVNVSFRDFQAGLQRFEQLSHECAIQTKSYLESAQTQPDKQRALLNNQDYQTSTRTGYLNEKYHY